MIGRRRFLLMGSGSAFARELSCESLCMRLVDARLAGTTPELIERLERELGGVRELRLRDSAWLAHAELERSLVPLLEAFRARGGHVELA